jgi:hypothetical protein
MRGSADAGARVVAEAKLNSRRLWESAENPALSVKSPVVEETLGVNLDLIRMFERPFEWASAPKNEVESRPALNLRPEML